MMEGKIDSSNSPCLSAALQLLDVAALVLQRPSIIGIRVLRCVKAASQQITLEREELFTVSTGHRKLSSRTYYI